MKRKKYEFTGETLELSSMETLHRIRAIIDIPNAGVNAGDIGGWIESDSNLSHSGNAWVSGDAKVSDHASVSDNAQICGRMVVLGETQIGGNAHIKSDKDFITIGPIGSRNGFVTFHKSESEDIYVECGCFSGTMDEFLTTVNKTHGNNRFGRE